MFTKTTFKELFTGSLFATVNTEQGQPAIFGKARIWTRTDHESATRISAGRYGAFHFDPDDEVYLVDGEQAESTLLLQFIP